MSQQEKIKFVVKNGRYAGSIIELDPDQEYSLGRSFHCDIAIDDSRFAERQMLLNVSQDGVQIKLLAEGRLSVNGDSKDTNAQSEWRHMDPRSAFVMNDLEFSFEVPNTLLAQFQQRAKAPELEAVTAGEQDQSGASRKGSQSSASDFGELETQVPASDESDDYPDNDEIQVMPNLADELEFESNQGPKYTRKTQSSQTSSDEGAGRQYVLWGAVGAGLVLFIGVYYLIGLPSDKVNNDMMADSVFEQSLEQQARDAQAAAEDNLTPFVLQDDTAETQATVSFTDPQNDDPFLAYDQSKAALDGRESPDIPEVPVVTEQPPLPEDQLVDSGADNSLEFPVEQAPKDISDSDVAAPSPGLSFGQLESVGSADVSPLKSENQPVAKDMAQSAQGQQANGVWAVMSGAAKPETIALQSAQDLLGGLALGQLNAVTRAPRKVAGKLEKEPVVVVSGYVNDRRTWMRAKEILAQDVEGLGTLVDEVSSPEVRKAQLESWISKSDIKGKVKTYLSERGLVAKVNLNPSQVDTWQRLAKEYVEKFDNNPELFVMRDPGDWLQIQSISFGARPYLVTSDGAVLSPGAKLSNGYSIVAIRRSGVELRDQFGTYTYVF